MNVIATQPRAAARDETAILPLRSGAWGEAERAHSQMVSLFGSEAWIAALEATYGFDIETAALHRGGGVGAAFSFADVIDARGRRIVSLPFSDYIDPLVDDLGDWRRLVDPILARGAPVRFRTLRNPVPDGDDRFEKRSTALWHATDLAVETDGLWSEIGPAARQNVRRAERRGLTVSAGRTLRDVELFYELHLRVRKSKYRLLAQPFSFFANLYDAFSSDDRIVTLLARDADEVVAGILFLIDRGTLYYKFNASTDLRYRPNDLLVWHGMRLGRERRLGQLDFGISDVDQPGLVRFKRKFATVEHPVAEYRWSPPGAAAGDRGVDPLLRQLTAALTDPATPDEVTRAAGDDLYRLFC